MDPAQRCRYSGEVMAKLDRAAIEQLLHERFPEFFHAGNEIVSVGGGAAALQLDVTASHLRPGGTVSGPVLMTLADSVAFVAILAEVGPVLMALTSSMTIHFLRRAQPGRLIGQANIAKLGRNLAVVQVEIHASSTDEPVAIASVAYAIPNLVDQTERSPSSID